MTDLKLSTTKIFTLEDVSKHTSDEDFWIIIYEKVLDVSEFKLEHPGGEEALLEYAGKDGTLAFEAVGHSNTAMELIPDYQIGILAEDDLKLLEETREVEREQRRNGDEEQKGGCVIM